MKSTSLPIKLGDIELSPAPFVSSSYEYIRSGSYIIGGTLNITLSGTILGKEILTKISKLNAISSNNDCLDLIIGCEGSGDFVSGTGRIVNVSITKSDDSPFTASYTIVVALEMVGSDPAVKADLSFLTKFGINENDAKYIRSYEEEIGVDGDATVIGYYDQELGVSKSFIKASGSISITSATNSICGDPSFNGIDQSFSLLSKRFQNLISFTFNETGHPLSEYSSWTKWLDTKTITIDESGKVSCSFEIYLTKGGCTPMAHIDVKTEDKLDHKNSNGISNRSITGTIKGISSATTSLLENKTRATERLSNAQSALNTIINQAINGSWPGAIALLKGSEGNCTSTTCEAVELKKYQRLSSNISVSKVAGEITFTAEFGPVSSCETDNFSIESSAEEELPAVLHREFILPNEPNSIIQYIADTPKRVTITAQGSIKNCDTNKKSLLIECVNAAFNKVASDYNAYIETETQITDSKFSYKKTSKRVLCA